MSAWSVPGYSEVRAIGEGGGGRVVEAEHETGTPVAIKYLSERLRGDQGFLTQFREEARLLIELRDPHVARIYEYVEGDTGAAIVMELLEGASLRAMLKQHGPTGPEAALAVLKGSLQGLAAAHAAGVVHRDYKPDNVLVDGEGHSRLIDFGVAVRTGSPGAPAGTPPYMAPEQWHSGAATPATDVYAATAVFFECLTGVRPYRATNTAVLMHAHRNDPIPVDEVPEPIRPLVAAGLAKDARDRPASAAAFLVRLEEVAQAAYGADWEERGRRRLGELAALLLLLLPAGQVTAQSGTTFGQVVLRTVRTYGVQIAAVAALVVVIAGVVAIVSAGRNGTDTPLQRGAPVFTLPTTPETFPVVTPTPEFPTGAPTPLPLPSATVPEPSLPIRPVSAGPSASPTRTAPAPEGTRTPAPTPTARTTPTPRATPTGPPEPAPQPTVTDEPQLPPPPRNDTVRELGVAGLRTEGAGTGVAAVSVTTGRTSPVRLTVTFTRGATRVDSTTVTLSGSTRYTRTFRHTYADGLCDGTWGVIVSTEPRAANGIVTEQTRAPSCVTEVRDLQIESLDVREGGDSTGVVTVTTTGTGPVVLTARFGAGEGGSRTQTFTLSGATSYRRTVTHDFAELPCRTTVTLTAATDPAAPGGSVSRQARTPDCQEEPEVVHVVVTHGTLEGGGEGGEPYLLAVIEVETANTQPFTLLGTYRATGSEESVNGSFGPITLSGQRHYTETVRLPVGDNCFFNVTATTNPTPNSGPSTVAMNFCRD
ncbi:protein kinase domain-containing protein [Rhizohabitans arisaemae]|uniref:protein kinase domain-containing protein n=1 Tax=Rhizohabitans arisaemae TaxID=2720610 RepID=UPI0024B1FE4E|nr:serine/threonine protein kinase [Rhizohabitans arisaemae]